jgi:hypothetical protein
VPGPTDSCVLVEMSSRVTSKLYVLVVDRSSAVTVTLTNTPISRITRSELPSHPSVQRRILKL